MTIILITGPSRSGKSEWAERLAAQISTDEGLQVVYVATARVSTDDREWHDRIQKHKDRRPNRWQVEEIPVELVSAIARAPRTACLLIDSLGTWLANLIEQTEADWTATEQSLLQALSQTAATVIMVAEETGWGIVPAYELGRRFRDRLGHLSRATGQLADDVYLVTSGYAINLSTLGQPVDP
ncbi:MAG: bifunctional adenosylcobinamide kinase/adenosylcobinamide-phosphate guanylyltransferase [Cyanobacteria bacterium J06588_5]